MTMAFKHTQGGHERPRLVRETGRKGVGDSGGWGCCCVAAGPDGVRPIGARFPVFEYTPACNFDSAGLHHTTGRADDAARAAIRDACATPAQPGTRGASRGWRLTLRQTAGDHWRRAASSWNGRAAA